MDLDDLHHLRFHHEQYNFHQDEQNKMDLHYKQQRGLLLVCLDQSKENPLNHQVHILQNNFPEKLEH